MSDHYIRGFFHNSLPLICLLQHAHTCLYVRRRENRSMSFSNTLQGEDRFFRTLSYA